MLLSEINFAFRNWTKDPHKTKGLHNHLHKMARLFNLNVHENCMGKKRLLGYFWPFGRLKSKNSLSSTHNQSFSGFYLCVGQTQTL